jgi:hypothetical protein
MSDSRLVWRDLAPYQPTRSALLLADVTASEEMLMRVITDQADHQIVDFGADEALPAPYDQATKHCYRPTAHDDGAAGRTFIRTPLVPNTQIKIWRGLIDPAVVENLLATGEIESSQFLPGSSVEGALKMTLTCGLVGVFKPARSDDPMTGYHWSEITAYQVDRAIGLNCVPVTVDRAAPESGSIQLWVEGLTEMPLEALPKDLLFFDKLTANSDRGGNIYANFKAHAHAPRGCVAFDNGCSFTAMVTGLAEQKEAIRPQQPFLTALNQLNPDSFTLLVQQHRERLRARVNELRQLYAI